MVATRAALAKALVNDAVRVQIYNVGLGTSSPGRNRAVHSVLVVDDEESVHRLLERPLEGYRVYSAYSGWQALRELAAHHVDVVLLDLNLPDTTGQKLLEQIRADYEGIEVIVVTSHSAISVAVETVKAGAFDFVVKGAESYRLLPEYIERAIEFRRHRLEQLASRGSGEWLEQAFAQLERSKSSAVEKLIETARKVASTPVTVLIEGESGSGKEILARYLHARSDDPTRPFVAVNISAVPSNLVSSYLFGHVKGAFTGADRTRLGKFELANGGTLFLDEVGELDLDTQVKLLRVLQEGEIERVGGDEPTPVQVRVIAATNKVLSQAVADGTFREDLYYRLSVINMRMPPLRDRKSDLAGLIELLIAKHAATLGRKPCVVSQAARDILDEYEWPGNIRELENLITRLVALHPGKHIAADDIPPEYWLPRLNKEAASSAATSQNGSLYQTATAQFQRYLLRLMIARCGGNKQAAARALGVSYSTIKQKTRED